MGCNKSRLLEAAMKPLPGIRTGGVSLAFICFISAGWLYSPILGLLIAGGCAFLIAAAAHSVAKDEEKERLTKAKLKDPEDRPLKEKACNSSHN